MRVVPVPCGPAVNESERLALEKVKAGLVSLPGDGRWYLLSNLMFSVNHQFQSDEIDLVAVGPPGVRVVEVKHWSDAHAEWAEREADKVTLKARKVGSTLRRLVKKLPRVDGAVLLTHPPSKVKQLVSRGKVRGVEFHPLKEWRRVIRPDEPKVLSPQQVERLAKMLVPRSAAVQVSGDLPLRRLAGYVNLELQTEPDESFHRIYKGVHSSRKDRVFLHLYDLSVPGVGSAERTARREHDVLHHQLSRFAWAPRILDSFQDAPGYADEMKFFTVVDPAVPSIEERAGDADWGLLDRLAFARRTIRAVKELHGATTDGLGLVHRNLSPRTILVKHDNTPVLTGFEHVGTPAARSASLAGYSAGEDDSTIAPEVRKHGLAVADQRSDVYSLCASLAILFAEYDGNDGWQVPGAKEALEGGVTDAAARPLPTELEEEFAVLLGQEVPPATVPPARFWTEDQEVRFQNGLYRVVARLGSGGVGTTFKVIELDRATKREVGTFVGKVVGDEETGKHVRLAYKRARQSVSQHPGLSTVLQVAEEWRENEFLALSAWIEGAALADYTGVVPLLAEDHDQEPEELVLGWLRQACEALDVLHRNGLVHGDVSPGNILVSGDGRSGTAGPATERLVLTDYDFITPIGEAPVAPGAILYGSPNRVRNGEARPSDDLYALAATFFQLLFDQKPFVHDQRQQKECGLNWEHGDRAAYPRVAAFLDQATAPDAESRFASVSDALEALMAEPAEVAGPTELVEPVEAEAPDDQSETPTPPPPLPALPTVPRADRSRNQVEWLRDLLQSYPGSRWGNRETRGLDSEFARRTYVTTELEETLYQEVLDRQVRLVVLCGNAGDGKTALLQHLADRLGLGRHRSAQRIIEGDVGDGLRVRVNFDGSAAWEGRSADELLDEFLEPFQQGPPKEDVVHLLAINDGRLLEWIGRGEDTPLKDALTKRLHGDGSSDDQISFYSLNSSSHVGGIAWDSDTIDTSFLDQLVDRLYGGDAATATWSSCATCSAQDRCGVYAAAQVFGSAGLSRDDSVRLMARRRLFEALQAVHFRGETHITVRELRSSLIYVLFGTDYCTDYHLAATSPNAQAYWDRAFDPGSHARQGEVLTEMVRLDPGLEAHPKVDRKLLEGIAHDRDGARRLASARRRAYFEGMGDDTDGFHVDLAQGGHLRRFRDVPFLNDLASDKLRTDLVRGIARLGDLPAQALRRDHEVVPLRIQPRTPTETTFWSDKAIDRFRLESEVVRPTGDDMAAEYGPLAQLHRGVFLVYAYENGGEEQLRMGAELFHQLLELGEGYQLGDLSTDDAFANLSIFLRRLLREDDRWLTAWSPIREEAIYRISAEIKEGSSRGPVQCLVIQPVQGDGDE